MAGDADFARLSLTVVRDRLEPALQILAKALTAATRSAPDPPATPSSDPMRIRERLLASLLGATTPGTGLLFVTASGDVKRDELERALSPLVVTREDTLPARRTSATRGRALIVDFPGASQSHILLGQPLPPSAATDPLMAHLVGYALRSRLMSNLRSDKGWSYEIFPFGADLTRSTAALRFNIPVQTAKTAESISEILAEIRRLREELVTEEFLASIRGHVASEQITAGLTSLQRMNGQLVDLARLDLPSTWYATATERLTAVTPQDLRAAAAELLRPDGLIWIIAGRREEVERELSEIGMPVGTP